jgi:serine protease Do
MGDSRNFNMDFDHIMPKIQSIPRVGTPYAEGWSWSGGGPRLGISVQDTEDGKGVNVIEVDEDGNAAKAGIKEDDIITEVDGKAINSADEIAKLMKESKEKVSVKVKLLRNGKTENVEVKIPRKLKKADL